VVDDLGQQGRVYRTLKPPIWKLSSSTCSKASTKTFNTAEKWSQDVTADVAHELRHRRDLRLRDVPFGL
jgi:hypothetical protein